MSIEAAIVINGVAAILNYVAYRQQGFVINRFCAYTSGGLCIGTILGYIAYGIQ